jgi:hypothetical protein
MIDDLFVALNDLILEHWAKFLTAALFMGVGWYVGKQRERRNWKNRDFLDRLHVSLNSVRDNRLLIRTLLEKSAESVLLNKVAVSNLKKYAARTTPGNPLIPIPAADRWYYLNAILNEISGRFADGLLVADNGLPVHSARYLVCLTREAEGDVRTQKIRAMLIRKELLRELPAEMPRLEQPHHRTRWQTLQVLAETYHNDPDHFLEIEIAVPCHGGGTTDDPEASASADAPPPASTSPD